MLNVRELHASVIPYAELMVALGINSVNWVVNLSERPPAPTNTDLTCGKTFLFIEVVVASKDSAAMVRRSLIMVGTAIKLVIIYISIAFKQSEARKTGKNTC